MVWIGAIVAPTVAAPTIDVKNVGKIIKNVKKRKKHYKNKNVE
jgi:hypothetical protein